MIEVARITSLLQDVNAGRDGAMDELMNVVYADLERVAHRHIRERFGPAMDRLTLEPASLVNESFLRLLRQREGFDNRQQFFAIATRIMLRVLVDYCRQRGAAKRGGDVNRISITFDDAAAPAAVPNRTAQIELEALMNALETLESLDPRKADVVRMRVVWGMQNDQVAEALGVSVPTVERDWRFARAWLADAVAPREGGSGDRRISP
jgi:RNA polymerase sigma factor (TIGR02999 family)